MFWLFWSGTFITVYGIGAYFRFLWVVAKWIMLILTVLMVYTALEESVTPESQKVKDTTPFVPTKSIYDELKERDDRIMQERARKGCTVAC